MLITINNGKTTVRLAAHEKRALAVIREMALTASTHLKFGQAVLLAELDDLEAVVFPARITANLAGMPTEQTDETDSGDD